MEELQAQVVMGKDMVGNFVQEIVTVRN